MKKIFICLLTVIILLNLFSVVIFANNEYDSNWTMTTDKSTYNIGDYLILTIKNSTLINPYNGCTIHFTFNKELLEYVTDENVLYDDLGLEPKTLPGVALYGTSQGGELTKDGEFIDTVADIGTKIKDDKEVYTVYFKVKENIEGTHQLNFRWILNSEDHPSWVVQSIQGTTGDIENYLNINFVDTSVVVNGNQMAEDNKTLSSNHSFASATKNDLNGKTIDINGIKQIITSDYAMAFGRVAPRNNGIIKIKAGFILSATNTDLKLGSKNAKEFEALNFASDNIFAGLFYGPGLKPGTTYYVMPYVTYSDGITLYAAQPLSFTMPE